MPFNKISGQSNNPPALPIALAGGEVMMLPTGQGIIGAFGQGSYPQLNTGDPLTGQYLLQLGQYTTLQQYDDGLNAWRDVQVTPNSLVTVSADGANFRIANTTGTPIGALITNAGSSLTNGWYGYNNSGAAITIQNGATTVGNSTFTVTPSAGGSLWNAIVGGAVSTTMQYAAGTGYANLANFYVSGSPAITTSPGANYQRPPIIVFTPPPNQGQQPYILPTAVCGLTAGAISSVTVTSQGAGLLGLPGVTVIPQPGDTLGGGAVLGWASANATQAGSGTLLAMYPAFPGTALTAVPTFTFSPASTLAATPIMNFTVTGFTQTTTGAGYVGAGGVFQGGIVAGTAANTNPLLDKALSIPVYPPVTVAATTGLPALAGPFGGVNFQSVPTFASFSSGAAPSTAAVTTVNVGGANDVVLLMSF